MCKNSFDCSSALVFVVFGISHLCVNIIHYDDKSQETLQKCRAHTYTLTRTPIHTHFPRSSDRFLFILLQFKWYTEKLMMGRGSFLKKVKTVSTSRERIDEKNSMYFIMPAFSIHIPLTQFAHTYKPTHTHLLNLIHCVSGA